MFRYFFRLLNKFVNAIKLAIKDTIYLICDIFDFHSVIHHNKYLNKFWYNILIEFIENFIIMSIPIVYLANTYNIRLTIPVDITKSIENNSPLSL